MTSAVCPFCRWPLNPALRWPNPGSTSADHVVPRHRGGTETVPAHLYCNMAAGGKWWLYPDAAPRDRGGRIGGAGRGGAPTPERFRRELAYRLSITGPEPVSFQTARRVLEQRAGGVFATRQSSLYRLLHGRGTQSLDAPPPALLAVEPFGESAIRRWTRSLLVPEPEFRGTWIE